MHTEDDGTNLAVILSSYC